MHQSRLQNAEGLPARAADRLDSSARTWLHRSQPA